MDRALVMHTLSALGVADDVCKLLLTTDGRGAKAKALGLLVLLATIQEKATRKPRLYVVRTHA